MCILLTFQYLGYRTCCSHSVQSQNKAEPQKHCLPGAGKSRNGRAKPTKISQAIQHPGQIGTQTSGNFRKHAFKFFEFMT